MFDYFSAVDAPQRVVDLEQRMAHYYATNHAYYDMIHFATSAWVDSNEHIHQDLLKHATSANGRICEVGCGRSQALTAGVIDPSQYSGCDFSSELLNRNREDFPNADFTTLLPSAPLPYDDQSFDFVFTVFVLEHVVRPDRFLSELSRICKVGGKIALLCPDYYGRLSMASQMIGWASDSGMCKLRRGHVVDAVWSSFVARVLLPRYLKSRLKNAHARPVFLLNGNPSCFSRPFYPDADAVYVTHLGEIENHFRACGVTPCQDLVSAEAQSLAKQRGLLYALFSRTSVRTK